MGGLWPMISDLLDKFNSNQKQRGGGGVGCNVPLCNGAGGGKLLFQEHFRPAFPLAYGGGKTQTIVRSQRASRLLMLCCVILEVLSVYNPTPKDRRRCSNSRLRPSILFLVSLRASPSSIHYTCQVPHATHAVISPACAHFPLGRFYR